MHALCIGRLAERRTRDYSAEFITEDFEHRAVCCGQTVQPDAHQAGPVEAAGE